MSARLLLEEFRPRSELVVPEHHVARARFSAIDVHNHITDRLTGVGWLTRDPLDILGDMDEANVASIVNLNGGTGDVLKANVAMLDAVYPGRFFAFSNMDERGLGEPGWTERVVAQLRADVTAGARGLKVFPDLGLRVRDTKGVLVAPDDPRLFDLWEQAGELDIPVLIHTADPVAFFRPLDGLNERWDVLQRHPEWRYADPDYPSFMELIASLYRAVEAHPKTRIIAAHVGCYPENLGYVSAMLDRYSNLYVDMSRGYVELGRAPYSARAWFLKYADRILFGTDVAPISVAWYRTYFRFLETSDEYFDYAAPGAPYAERGRFRIYGLYLPDDVLQKVYHDNAARLLKLY